jgi:hypothetical protein
VKKFKLLDTSKQGLVSGQRISHERGSRSSTLLTRPLFRLGKNFKSMNSTTFVLFDKYCPIVDQLGSKDSSHDLQLNCVISYFFTYI